MQKFIVLAFLSISVCFTAGAQDTEKKIKKTSSVPQKIHNTFSRHKRHNGFKVTTERNGVERKHKVNTHTGEVKDKKEK